MEFIKNTVGNVVNKLLPKKDPASLDSCALLKQLLNSSTDRVDVKALHRLAELSFDNQNYPAIVKRLVKNLSNFDYELKAERVVGKALTVAAYLVKAGSEGFLFDFTHKREVMEKLSEIDVHHFQNKHPKDKKELEYLLQIIRQRASFLCRLLQDPTLLEEERSKMPRDLEIIECQSESQTVNSLITPFQSPQQKNFKIKFSGVTPLSKLEENALQWNEVLPTPERKAKKSQS